MSSVFKDNPQEDFLGNIESNITDSVGHSGSILVDGEKYLLPGVVIQNIKKVIDLQTNQEKNMPASEKILSRLADACGRPNFLYFQLSFFGTWWLYSRIVNAGVVDFGWPLSNLQNQGINAALLLIATGVLVRQAQYDKILEQRSHLMLQVNLLNEQKAAKLIELLEALDLIGNRSIK